MLDTVFIAFNVCVAFVLPTGAKVSSPLNVNGKDTAGGNFGADIKKRQTKRHLLISPKQHRGRERTFSLSEKQQ